MVDYFWKCRTELPSEKKSDFSFIMCENLKKHDNIVETFDYLYSIDKKLFISGVKDIFSHIEERKEIYELLNNLYNRKNFFVTTNIDNGLQKYLKIPDDNVSINPKFYYNPPKLITYLHGRIDNEESWIFTTEQYYRGYSKDSAPCKQYLKLIFENYNVLFIGYGLNENEILSLIRLTNKRKIHYWLEGSNRNKLDYLKIRSTTLKENYNIELIPYNIDQNGYETLYDVISLLYEVMSNKEGGIK